MTRSGHKPIAAHLISVMYSDIDNGGNGPLRNCCCDCAGDGASPAPGGVVPVWMSVHGTAQLIFEFIYRPTMEAHNEIYFPRNCTDGFSRSFACCSRAKHKLYRLHLEAWCKFSKGRHHNERDQDIKETHDQPQEEAPSQGHELQSHEGQGAINGLWQFLCARSEL